MKKNQVKEELINRYKYIYENATYILAPFMHQQTQEERNALNEKYRKKKEDHIFISDQLSIYLKSLSRELLLDLESFLLSDIPFNQSKLYIELEEKKKNLDYLNIVKNGLSLLDKKNAEYESNYFKIKLNIWNLLSSVRGFINEQSSDLKNKTKKLNALDEYFRINRYTNDGKVWTSGCSMNFKDLDNYEFFSMVTSKNTKEPSRDKKDIGLKKGVFISYVSNPSNHYDYNYSLLTEREKQDLYLLYHDELPWDLMIKCENNLDYDSETILIRPENTNPCGENFYIKEKEIFESPNNNICTYFQLCPHCGYMVNIPSEILSNGIMKRIQERCSKDPTLFEKMYLQSKNAGLEKNKTKGQKQL